MKKTHVLQKTNCAIYFPYRPLNRALKENKKDFGTQRSLINLVGKRRKLLNYLMKVDIMRYRNIVKELGLRK